MKRSGAVWLVLGVIAVAAALMYFVVLPQVRDGKTVQDIARKAEETVKDVKQTVNDAAKQVEDVADGGEEVKAAALVKMERIGQDTKGAADELKALLAKGTPSADQLAAAKAKLAAALKSASEFKLPANADSAATAAADRIAEGARAALATLDALPADPAAAQAALADMESKLIAALPQGVAVTSDDPMQAAESGDDAAATQAKTEEKKTDGAKPAVEAGVVVPAFDILRVEKDGSTVIAGRSEPGAKVEIVDGDKVIASTQADGGGDFAAVLDDPLASGDHSIVLKSTTKDGKSSTSAEVATVSVPKDASGELLAMVTKPGEASRIITMPEAKDTNVASNTGVTSEPSQETRTADGAATAAEPSKDAAEADGTTGEKTASDVAATTPDLPANSTDIASTPPVVAQEQPAGSAEQQQAAAESATPADATQAERKQPDGAPEVMVSAVELEGDKIFIAGNTRPGATVRIYADDQIVAEAKADNGGRFVVDGTIKLSVGDHTIRADVLSADGAKVEYRASVPFFRPEGDLAAVASVDPAKAGELLADGAFDKAREEAAKALTLLQNLYAGGKMPSAEELAAARSSAEFALKSLAEARLPDGVDPALAAMAAEASEEAGKALDRLKAVPADVAAFKSALGDVETIVASAIKPATEVADASDMAAGGTKPADTAQAAGEPVEKTGDQVSSNDVQVTPKVERLAQSADATAGDQAAAPADGAETTTQTGDQSASQQTASADQPKVIEQAPLTQSKGSVIIRRGDTLWQISRRVYGKGVRYTTIYMANQAQIEDPDRIKPGQIFSMPGKWLENSEELHKERLQHHHRQ